MTHLGDQQFKNRLSAAEIDRIVDTVQVHANMRAHLSRADLLNRHCQACTLFRNYGLAPSWDPWAWDWTGL